MMLIKVLRFKSDNDTTISMILVNDRFVCFGLEDEYRDTKLYGETRIDADLYKVGVRTVGGFHARYSDRFPEFHKGMLEILAVPNFEYVLIHIGNDDDDTAACLLVGMGCYSGTGNMTIQNSTQAYKILYDMVIDEALKGNLYIQFVDMDRKIAT